MDDKEHESFLLYSDCEPILELRIYGDGTHEYCKIEEEMDDKTK